MINEGDKDYAEAVSDFNIAGDYEDADEHLRICAYNAGIHNYKTGCYSDAEEMFETADGYEDSAKWIENCGYATDFSDAESSYDAGELKTAKEKFSNLPKDYKLNGVSVKSRLNRLEKYKAFVNLCGTYSGKGKCEVRQTSKNYGAWKNWTNNPSSYEADVNCVIFDSGKVSVSGSVNYYRYTTYSTIAEGLEGLDDSETFSFMTTSPSQSHNIGNHCSIYFQGGKMIFKYKEIKKNEDVYFNYLYETNMKYKKVSSK